MEPCFGHPLGHFFRAGVRLIDDYTRLCGRAEGRKVLAVVNVQMGLL